MKKRFISVLLAVGMVFGLLPAAVGADQPDGMKEMAASAAFVCSGGDGTEEDPYLISNLDDLEAFRDYINSDADGGSGEYFKLTADIDMSGKYKGSTSWTPIGANPKSFKGTFDGGGHTISGLYINITTGTKQGLFGNSSGTIKNLSVSGSVTGNGRVGGIVGENSSGGVISDCINNCSVTGNSDYVGGIVGYNYYSIINCYNTGTVSNSGSNNKYIGGIVGYNSSNGSIENCHNKGTITGKRDYAGGIAGSNEGSAKIENCYNTGKVSGASCVGGIAGSNQSSNFRNCYNMGEVSGTGDSVGGIVGSNSSSVKNCYYLGTGTESEGTAKTADQFASGEVAWLLQNGQDAQAWGQTVGDGYPELTDEEAKKVYKVTFMTDGEEHATRYANPNGTVTLPSEPVNDDHKFLKWSQSEGAKGAEFNASTNVNSDMTVYAVWDESPFDGSGTAEDPYRIPDLATLEAFRDYINNDPDGGSGEYFKVTAEIDMSTKYGADKGEGGSWTPIGTSSTPFSGTFDGGGFEISGLYINTEDYYTGLFGYSTGTIKNLTVSGSVTGGTYTGGIVGSNHGVISDCISNCAVSGSTDKDYIGGITGYNDYSGSIKNCYNTGTVSSTNTYIGGIAGSSDGSIENCYYLDTSCNAGGGGTSKTAEQFASGEVAWLLQNGQDAQVWGQKLGDGADEYPVLTSDANKKVLKVTFAAIFAAIEYDNYAARYANPNGTVTLPDDPVSDGYTFYKWSKTSDANGETFDASTRVTGDMTVYAVGREHFGSDSGEIVLDGTYGYGAPLTVNLDEHMKYANTGISSEGKFEYSIASDEKRTGASISGSTLTVPTGLGAGEYTIQITAKEKAPQYALMSVGSYGTADVTLTVKVTIAKANATVTAPTANTLTYTGAAQALVTAGSAVGGEMRYSLDGISYSTDIPKGTEAKTYTVWYKVVGDGNHNDTAAAYITVTIGKASPTVTAPVARELTYTGAAQQLITAGETAHGALKYAVGVAAPSDDSQWETNASQITGANAGTYSVWWKVAGDANHTDTEPAQVTVTIGKAQAQVTVAPTPVTATYTGADVALVTGGTSNFGSLVYSLAKDGPFSADIPTATEAGTYTVYYKVEGTSNWDASEVGSVQAVIQKAASSATVTGSIDLVYSGAAQGLVASGTSETGTVVYALGKDESTVPSVEAYTKDIPTGTDAGTYYVWWKVTGDADHNDTAPACLTVTIAKASPTVTAPTARELTYAGEAQQLITAGTATGGVMLYYMGAEAPGDDSQWETDASQITGADAGTYTVWYKLSGDANHTDMEARSISVTIGKASATVTAPKANTLTYNGAAQDLITGGSVTSAVAGCGEMQDSLDAESGFSTAIPTGEEAGTYTVYWKVNGADTVNYDYSDATDGQITVTVGKAAPEVTAPEAKNLTYTGEELELVTAGSAVGGEMQYSLDGSSYSTGIPKSASAGDYTVWYKVVGDANHTNTEAQFLSVTIGKAQAAVTVTPAAKELTYTGEALALVTAGEANFGSLVYSLHEEGPFQEAVPTGKEAGTYTVYYKVEGSENWDGSDVGSVQVEIKKAASSATVTGQSGLVYSGEEQALVTAENVTGGTVVYALGDNAAEAPAEGYQETVPTGTDAGTYYVWWKVQGDANHNDTAAQSVTVTVAPFALTFEPVAAETPYTGAAISVTVSQTTGEAPAIDPAAIAVSYEQNGAAAEPVLPGTYDVLVTVTDPNFTLAGTAKVGTLTVTHVHVYAEAWTQDTEDHWHVCQGVGACDAPRSGLAAHVWDEGVVTLEPTAEAEGNRLYTCGVCGANKNEPISKLDTFRISGVVTDSDGNPLAQAVVRLTRGQVIVAETITDSQGRYSFSSVPAGLYNVAATWETVTKTILVELSDADANERDIQMPEGKVSSVVEVLGEDTPDVVVGGVDAAAEAEAAASPAGSVTVTLTVEKKDTPDDKEALEAAASSQAAHLTYLDMTLTKTTTGTGSSEEPITETGVVLEIVIPFDFTSKNNVTVYRSHDNEAAALTKADGDARIDGTFRLDEAGGKIYIYASKFSTYAIGYTPAPPALPPYPADVVQTEHGSLEVSPSPAAAGSRVTVTVTPDEGYEPGTLTVTDRSGNAVSVEDNGDGTFTFVMPAGGVEVEAIFVPACKRDETCPLSKFTDAAPTAWYHDGVHYCVEHGLMVGTSATEFAPDMPASRAMIVVILWREEGCPVVNYLMPYDDVAPETWYTEAVRWATSEGIVGGYGNGHFGPDDPITREQLGVMLWRYAKNKGRSVSLGEDTNILSFKDFGQISDWAVPALQWAAGCGILQGKDGVLDPQGQITRAQAADMLQRFFTSKKVAPLTTG